MAESRPQEIRILHVDDDPAFLDLVETVMGRAFEQVRVARATEPEEGSAQLEDEPIDCVVSDYGMPGTNGLKFPEAVRERYPSLPFVLFTGKGSEEIAGEAISTGVSDYLQKGPGMDRIRLPVNRVENVVAKAAAEREVERTRNWSSTLLAHIPDLVFVADEGGVIDYCSPSVEPIMGDTPEELVGTNAFDYIHPDDVELATEALARALESPEREVTVEYRVRKKDGSWADLEVWGRNLLDDPTVEGVIVNARGVSAPGEAPSNSDGSAGSSGWTRWSPVSRCSTVAALRAGDPALGGEVGFLSPAHL